MPLANTLRPASLATFIGQTHLVAEGKPLKKLVDEGRVASLIFWGPPGVGKTTLARILAESAGRPFFELSAVSAKKDDIRIIVQQSEKLGGLLDQNATPVLFLDEIHRFNKAQQDYLLPFVETGQLTLIGATTENPSFEVNAALLSRVSVYTLKQLNETELEQILDQATTHLQKNKKKSKKIDSATKEWIINYSSGDARKLITLVEHAFGLYGEITHQSIQQAAQSMHISYDKKGEEHYNTISAFIKSMRASNTDAALYYLARMVAAGEDPTFIARRMVIFASEDVGLAQPTALVVANAVFDAVRSIGYPEAQINLAHGTAYLSQAKKDRSAYDAYFTALDDVKKFGNLPIPLHLRNAPTKLMKKEGYGKGYTMYPDPQTSLLPEKLKEKKYLKEK
ncbi:replication-associated recombination protein A [Candidatus Woesebacteria bacterium]|nr:replication-associated recombination protein A [Candidatus Woesebacteria bacterium]